MRKEASLKQWSELYGATTDLLALKPWTRYWDMDLIAVQSKSDAEPAFCSIMGRAGSCYGFGVYPGLEGLRDLKLVAGCGGTVLPTDYVMFEQSSLCCYCGDREEVPTQQRKIIKELGLKFRGRGNWVYFQSFKRRYTPWTPDENEVILLTNAFRAMTDVVIETDAKPISVDFENGDILWRTFDEKNNSWSTCGAPLPDVHKAYPDIILKDDLLKQRLKKQPRNTADIMMDFTYMNAAIADPKYDRPANPLLFLVMDTKSGMVIHTELMEPETPEIDAVLNYFISSVLQHGRMRVIRVRNPWVFSALSDVCALCGITLEEDSLEMVDDFLQSFKEHVRTGL